MLTDVNPLLTTARTLADIDVSTWSDTEIIKAYVDTQATQRNLAHFLRNLSHERAIRAHKDANA